MTKSSGGEPAAHHHWPNLWSRDGFLGTNSVVLRDGYLPDFKAVSGPHVPRRFNIADVVSADLTDPEALYWNELFDSVGKIREVTVIDPQSVPQRYVTVPQLLASSRRQKCRLCVVYGQNDVAYNVSRVVGALYDADTNELVAVIFAEQIVDPQEKTPPPADYPKGDERHKDAHWLAARRFEQLVRGFVLQLIERDREPGAPPAEAASQPASTTPAGR